mmetsp:Transcript_888/g.1471  ORF Transcript_888/g.1471 Transcript_888/m.1471 type:complete len:119 (-) Transcript_888:2577-2933(-)
MKLSSVKFVKKYWFFLCKGLEIKRKLDNKFFLFKSGNNSKSANLVQTSSKKSSWFGDKSSITIYLEVLDTKKQENISCIISKDNIFFFLKVKFLNTDPSSEIGINIFKSKFLIDDIVL